MSFDCKYGKVCINVLLKIYNVWKKVLLFDFVDKEYVVFEKVCVDSILLKEFIDKIIDYILVMFVGKVWQIDFV